jgi:hypothetical protein
MHCVCMYNNSNSSGNGCWPKPVASLLSSPPQLLLILHVGDLPGITGVDLHLQHSGMAPVPHYGRLTYNVEANRNQKAQSSTPREQYATATPPPPGAGSLQHPTALDTRGRGIGNWCCGLWYYISRRDSSGPPGVFCKYFYNYAHRLRLEKLLYIELSRSSAGYFKPLLDPGGGFRSETAATKSFRK